MYLIKLEQDDVFVSSEIKTFGKIVNIVSNIYRNIPNELFFKRAV